MDEIFTSFAPVFTRDSRALILGTSPSPASVRQQFYYGHAQNRFWRVLAELFGEGLPASVDDKIGLIKRNNLALWDVIRSCRRVGASDSTISGAVPNDIAGLLEKCPGIAAVFLNGAKAHELFVKNIRLPRELPVYKMPSTSPANAACGLPKLLESWSIIKEYL